MKNKLLLRLILSHLLALFAFKVGVSSITIIIFVFFLILRSVGLTVAYHRYFAHRSFKTSRFFQFILALWGGLSAQRGPLWWAAKHRTHHKYSDQPGDPHSPHVDSFFTSHIGWALKAESMETDYSMVKDFKKFPELFYFNKFHDLYMLSFALFIYVMGATINHYYPELGTSGAQMLVWVYVINTLVHVHLTFFVNSIGHLFGTKELGEYKCERDDKSGNIAWLALLTAGEGWHHNHHTFPYSARIGIKWYQIDLGYLFIKVFEKLNLIWNVKTPKKETLDEILRPTALYKYIHKA